MNEKIDSFDKKIDTYNGAKYKLDKDLKKYYNCPVLISSYINIGANIAIIVSIFNNNFDFIKSICTLGIANCAFLGVKNLRNNQIVRNNIQLDNMRISIFEDFNKLYKDNDTKSIMMENYHNIHFDDQNFIVKNDSNEKVKTYGKRK